MSSPATTRWSLIARAANTDSEHSSVALAELCAVWRPAVLGFLRRKSGSMQADDLTQDFFLHFIEQSLSRKAESARGRFRSFLYSALQRWWIDQQRAASAQKRGGALQPVDWDQLVEPASGDSPEAAFDHAWAACMLGEGLRRLRSEADRNGRLPLFDAASEYLLEEAESGDYSRAAASVGMQPNTFAVAVSRLRKRLRAVIQGMVADTTVDKREAADELRHLRAALRGG